MIGEAVFDDVDPNVVGADPCGHARTMVDHAGQRVSATDRLYLTGDVPTLIVWGDRDPILPVRHAHTSHASIPGSRLEIFEGIGHYPNREDPDRFAQVLIDFMTSTEPAAVATPQWEELLLRNSPLRPAP